MPARRGARSGRGWDAIPPRPARAYDEHPPGEPPSGDDAERGNVPTRRRRASPGGNPSGTTGGSFTSGGYNLSVPPEGVSPSGGYDLSGFGGGGSSSGGYDLSGAAGGGRGRRGGRQPGGGEAKQPAQTEGERAREICLRQLAVRPRTRAELAKA